MSPLWIPGLAPAVFRVLRGVPARLMCIKRMQFLLQAFGLHFCLTYLAAEDARAAECFLW